MFSKFLMLPYGVTDLEPYIDAQTIEVHYGKHLQTYVDNLNNILKDYPSFTEGKTLEDILRNPNEIPEEIRQSVINQGGGVYNHNLYFTNLSPNPCKMPGGILLEKINETFGSVEELKDELNKKAISIFGSGYASLVMDNNKNLLIKTTANQDTTLKDGLTPILTIDVWEHAYYLKYQNRRAEYVKNIWNVIDWSKVADLYNK